MDCALPNSSIDLKGQTALVTGASAGLGVRFAKTLAKYGAQVVVTARRLDRLESVATEIRAAGGRAVPLQLDVTDADQLQSTVAEAEKLCCPATILVNNAGIPDLWRCALSDAQASIP